MSSLSTGQKLLILFVAWVLLSGSIGGGAPPFKTEVGAVLVVEETGKHREYTESQLNAIQATDEKSIQALAKARGWQYFVLDVDDKDAFKNAAPWVTEAFKVERGELPWAVGATPESGFSAHLTSEDELRKSVEAMK